MASPDDPPSHSRRRAREALVQALYQWHYNPSDPRELEMELLEGGHLEGVDRGHFQLLLRKVVERLEAIDALIEPAIGPRRISELTTVELAILRVAVCELLERPDISSRVVIDEAVELAKAFGADQGYRFVNAVLDRIARERSEASPEPSPDAP